MCTGLGNNDEVAYFYLALDILVMRTLLGYDTKGMQLDSIRYCRNMHWTC